MSIIPILLKKKLQGLLLNHFKDEIIYWLNLLTDTSDTVYNGVNPTLTDIEQYADLINGEII